MPNPSETGNMIQDLMLSQDPAVSELRDMKQHNGLNSQLTPQPIAIVGAGVHTAAVSRCMVDFMRSIQEGGDVVVIDSIPDGWSSAAEPVTVQPRRFTQNPISRRRRLIDELNIGIKSDLHVNAPFPRKTAVKPKEKTQADLDALAAAEAKRARKAAKLRSRK